MWRDNSFLIHLTKVHRWLYKVVRLPPLVLRFSHVDWYQLILFRTMPGGFGPHSHDLQLILHHLVELLDPLRPNAFDVIELLMVIYVGNMFFDELGVRFLNMLLYSVVVVQDFLKVVLFPICI